MAELVLAASDQGILGSDLRSGALVAHLDTRWHSLGLRLKGSGVAFDVFGGLGG